MRGASIYALILLLCGHALAQNADIPRRLVELAQSFPSLEALTDESGRNYDALRKGDSSGRAEQGLGADVARSLILDRITAKVDLAYSRTLSSKLGDNNSMTRFALTGVQFVPSYELTWELPLNKLFSGIRRGRPSREAVDKAVEIERNAQASKLVGPYGEFDQARYTFLFESKPNEYCGSFYSMKVKALAVLQSAGRSGRDREDDVQRWVSARCEPPSAAVRSAAR